MTKRIFTFWEPRENIPEYLKLCMKTWKKFLPEYEIEIIDYSNLSKWLGENFYDEYLYENFSLPMQADAIRCALLNKYGGIWLDMDTIITSEKIRDILNIDSQMILVGTHIAFIIAKSGATVLRKWEKGLHENIKLHAQFNNSTFKRTLIKFFMRSKAKHVNQWDFLGNYILRKSMRTKNKKILYKLDRIQIKALPEINYMEENNIQTEIDKNYKNFYFDEELSDYALNGNQGVICLHNSWTPEKYKNMTAEAFLSQNNTLSEILKKIKI